MTELTQPEPPYSSLAAEKSLLAQILVNNEHLWDSTNELSASDFSLDATRKIYQRMLAMLDSGMAIDLLTLSEHLEKHHELKAVGGVTFLSELDAGPRNPAAVKSYITLIRDASVRRQALKQAERFTQVLHDGSNPTRDCITMMQEWTLSLTAKSDQSQPVHVKTFSSQAYEQLREISTSKREILGTPTGIASLDGSTTGIRRSEYWILAGRPGHGKSSFMLQTAASACGNDHATVGIFSLEMRKDALLYRLWGMVAEISSSRLRDPRTLRPEDWRAIDRAKAKVDGWKLHIDDTTRLTPQQIVARCYLMLRQHNVDLIFLDYIQKVRGIRGSDRRERVSGISEALLDFVKQTGCPVVALSQLRRPERGEDQSEPTMYMLKESGDLEADADTVLLIGRNFKEKTANIIIGKQRNGPTGKFDLTFNEDTLRFEQAEQPAAKPQQNLDYEED